MAIETVQKCLADTYHCVFVFVNDIDDAKTYIGKAGLEKADIYFAGASVLKSFNIKKLPALLAYKNDRLSLAYYGPFREKQCLMAISRYEGHQHK